MTGGAGARAYEAGRAAGAVAWAADPYGRPEPPKRMSSDWLRGFDAGYEAAAEAAGYRAAPLTALLAAGRSWLVSYRGTREADDAAAAAREMQDADERMAAAVEQALAMDFRRQAGVRIERGGGA
jgi:hypothetical protein